MFTSRYIRGSLGKGENLDQKIERGGISGLGGVVALKDNLCYQGHEVTASSAILKNFVTPTPQLPYKT